MIAVQAETARLTTPGMPAAGAQRLSEIGDTARAGLTEMRRLLGVLREDAQVVLPDRHPQPGGEFPPAGRRGQGVLRRGIAVISPGRRSPSTRAWGSPRSASLEGSPTRCGTPRGRPSTWKCATATATCGCASATTGQDRQPATPGGGHGLLGMRERAAAMGGELRAGPATVGGFLVEASLPGGDETGALGP